MDETRQLVDLLKARIRDLHAQRQQVEEDNRTLVKELEAARKEGEQWRQRAVQVGGMPPAAARWHVTALPALPGNAQPGAPGLWQSGGGAPFLRRLHQ